MTPNPGHEAEAEVHFTSLVTGDSISFRMLLDSTLGDTWEKAYDLLHEVRRAGDILQCGGREEGKSLMADLSLTLRQVRDDRLCGQAALEFEIKGPSGGARW